MRRTSIAVTIVCLGGLAVAASAGAQSSTADARPAPRPIGRVSFYANAATTEVDGLPSRGYSELTTSIAYQLPPDLTGDGVEYGVDARESGYTGIDRPRRVSIYEGFVGVRLADGALRGRIGHLWLTDLGSLGSIAGAMFEYRQPQESRTAIGRLRVGGFGGLEPNVAETGYVSDVKKYGGYVAFDGDRARRHVVGLVTIRNAALTERSVLTTTNFLPIGRRFFMYQAAEFDTLPPAGQASRGLSYFFSNARVAATSRLDLQGSYNRGRSIDTRSLAEDVITGRPITRVALDGLLYESMGGRATVAVVSRVRVYAGYSRDKTNRDDAATGRTTIGGYAGNVLKTGFDLTASDARIDGATRQYHSRYLSIGRQVGRRVYVSGDYTTSLAVIQFSRSDGIIIEQRPATTRISGNGVINVGRLITLLVNVDRTLDDTSRELRVLSGITYRFP